MLIRSPTRTIAPPPIGLSGKLLEFSRQISRAFFGMNPLFAASMAPMNPTSSATVKRRPTCSVPFLRRMASKATSAAAAAARSSQASVLSIPRLIDGRTPSVPRRRAPVRGVRPSRGGGLEGFRGRIEGVDDRASACPRNRRARCGPARSRDRARPRTELHVAAVDGTNHERRVVQVRGDEDRRGPSPVLPRHEKVAGPVPLPVEGVARRFNQRFRKADPIFPTRRGGQGGEFENQCVALRCVCSCLNPTPSNAAHPMQPNR